MIFCDNCGSYVKPTTKGFICPRCGKTMPLGPQERTEKAKKSASNGIFVIDQPPHPHATISQTCPKCGNHEAIHWISYISGEHAGIRRERTMQHFKCTKCSHSWGKSS